MSSIDVVNMRFSGERMLVACQRLTFMPAGYTAMAKSLNSGLDIWDKISCSVGLLVAP